MRMRYTSRFQFVRRLSLRGRLIAAFCLAAVFVLAYFDAKQEAAYRRAEGAGVSMRFNRFTDWLFDLTMSGLILLAALIMLGVI